MFPDREIMRVKKRGSTIIHVEKNFKNIQTQAKALQVRDRSVGGIPNVKTFKIYFSYPTFPTSYFVNHSFRIMYLF